MNKKLEKLIKKSNKELKERNIFQKFQILVEYYAGELFIILGHDGRQFPITTVKTEDMAIAAIEAYMVGLQHGENNSYPRWIEGGI